VRSKVYTEDLYTAVYTDGEFEDIQEISMNIENKPITNLEQAKEYFIAMGCSHFHITRENRQRREEYYALNISRNTEMLWRKQVVENCISTFPFDEPEKIGSYYRYLNDIIGSDAYYLETMINLAKDIYNIVPPKHIPLILIVIIGNNGSPTRGGLIEKVCNQGLTELICEAVGLAKKYIDNADNNNITIFGFRGYLFDVINAFNINENNDYLEQLRTKNNIEGFKYYQQGAKKGNVFSMRMLAQHYKDGKGCETDRAQTIYWLTQAAAYGSALAKKELVELKNLCNE